MEKTVVYYESWRALDGCVIRRTINDDDMYQYDEIHRTCVPAGRTIWTDHNCIHESEEVSK